MESPRAKNRLQSNVSILSILSILTSRADWQTVHLKQSYVDFTCERLVEPIESENLTKVVKERKEADKV